MAGGHKDRAPECCLSQGGLMPQLGMLLGQEGAGYSSFGYCECYNEHCHKSISLSTYYNYSGFILVQLLSYMVTLFNFLRSCQTFP